MTLSDLQLPVSYSESKQWALVFPQELASRLASLHHQYGTANCIPYPMLLTDGRLMLSADVLTEVEPGGLLHAMWQAADQSVLAHAVEVIPWADAVAMLPPDPSPYG